MRGKRGKVPLCTTERLIGNGWQWCRTRWQRRPPPLGRTLENTTTALLSMVDDTTCDAMARDWRGGKDRGEKEKGWSPAVGGCALLVVRRREWGDEGRCGKVRDERGGDEGCSGRQEQWGGEWLLAGLAETWAVQPAQLWAQLGARTRSCRHPCISRGAPSRAVPSPLSWPPPLAHTTLPAGGGVHAAPPATASRSHRQLPATDRRWSPDRREGGSAGGTSGMACCISLRLLSTVHWGTLRVFAHVAREIPPPWARLVKMFFFCGHMASEA